MHLATLLAAKSSVSMKADRTTVAALVLFFVAGVKGRHVEDARCVVAQATNEFSFRLYQELSRKYGNMMFSPLSVEAALAMAYLGASGETAQELAAGLGLPDNHRQVEAGFRTLIGQLQSSDVNMSVDIANMLYSDTSRRIRPRFLRSVALNLLADDDSVEFANEPKAARNTVNEWVEEKTRNRITNLLSQGLMARDITTLLENTVYFKGKWNPEDAASLKHHANSTSSKKRSLSYGKIKDLNTQVLQMKYAGGATVLTVLMPAGAGALARLEAALPTLDLDQLESQLLHDGNAEVALPTFKMEAQVDLGDALRKLGITAMFRNVAEFSGITHSYGHISRVLHKSFIEVSEAGTEAAAATGAAGSLHVRSSWPSRSTPSAAQRPFIFLLQDDSSGLILFMGRYWGRQ